MFKLSIRLMTRDILRLAGVSVVLSAISASLVLSFALFPKAPVLGGILAGTLAFLMLAVSGGFAYAFTVRHSPYLGYQHLHGCKLSSVTLVATGLPSLFSWLGIGLGVAGGYLLLTSTRLNTFAVFVKADAVAFTYGSYEVTPVVAGLVSGLLLTLVGLLILSAAVSPALIRKHATI